MNPKNMVKKVNVVEITTSDEIKTKEMFLYMDQKNVKIFDTDVEASAFTFKTNSIQQVCPTEAFCTLEELTPIHFNNELEHKIDESKKTLDAGVVQDCFLVYSLNVQTVMRNIFIVCPLVADTGRLKTSMKYFYLKSLNQLRMHPKTITSDMPYILNG